MLAPWKNVVPENSIASRFFRKSPINHLVYVSQNSGSSSNSLRSANLPPDTSCSLGVCESFFPMLEKLRYSFDKRQSKLLPLVHLLFSLRVHLTNPRCKDLAKQVETLLGEQKAF